MLNIETIRVPLGGPMYKLVPESEGAALSSLGRLGPLRQHQPKHRDYEIPMGVQDRNAPARPAELPDWMLGNRSVEKKGARPARQIPQKTGTSRNATVHNLPEGDGGSDHPDGLYDSLGEQSKFFGRNLPLGSGR